MIYILYNPLNEAFALASVGMMFVEEGIREATLRSISSISEIGESGTPIVYVVDTEDITDNGLRMLKLDFESEQLLTESPNVEERRNQSFPCFSNNGKSH